MSKSSNHFEIQGKEKLLSNYLEIITKTILQMDFAAQVWFKKESPKKPTDSLVFFET